MGARSHRDARLSRRRSAGAKHGDRRGRVYGARERNLIHAAGACGRNVFRPRLRSGRRLPARMASHGSAQASDNLAPTREFATECRRHRKAQPHQTLESFRKKWLQKVGSTGKHPAVEIRNAPDMDTSEKRFEL